jgi:hypothetical protein
MKLKKGQKVIMVKCGEAHFYPGKVWVCRSDSFKTDHKPSLEVVFLEGFAGWFWTEYLELATDNCPEMCDHCSQECERNKQYQCTHEVMNKGVCAACGFRRILHDDFEATNQWGVPLSQIVKIKHDAGQRDI